MSQVKEEALETFVSINISEVVDLMKVIRVLFTAVSLQIKG